MASAFLTGQLGAFATLDTPVTRPVSAAARGEMSRIAHRHGLSAAQAAEPARLAVAQKIVAGARLSIDEFEVLLEGARSDVRAAVAQSDPAIGRQTYR